MTTTILHSGSRVRYNFRIFTVHSIVRRYSVTTLRYVGDPNPIPAGSVVVRTTQHETVTLRPNTFEIIGQE